MWKNIPTGPIAPRFNLVQERSSNGAPSVTVTFADGYEDTLMLKKFYANERTRVAAVERCNYIGHLVNEIEACVAMTGCVGYEDVEFTILSTHAATAKSSKFRWTKEGNVQIMDSKVISFQFH